MVVICTTVLVAFKLGTGVAMKRISLLPSVSYFLKRCCDDSLEDHMRHGPDR